VAVATITMRKKEQLCAIRPSEGRILLETLFYPDEIEQARELDMTRFKVSEGEMNMAFTLIDLLRKPFEPEDYQDHYREALGELIEAKLKGKKVSKAPPARDPKVIDLADALRRSVAAAKRGGEGPKLRKVASRQAPARRARKKAS
jgi:DNA end-binding protein Ku